MRVLKNYLEANEKALEGYTVVLAMLGVNESESGILLKFEREIDNVTLGIDAIYNPEPAEGETEFMISDEYVKFIDEKNEG